MNSRRCRSSRRIKSRSAAGNAEEHDEEDVLCHFDDESRYVLNGIFLSLKDHKMTMVATDGRRLRWWTRKWMCREEPRGVHLPAKTVNELNRLLQEKGEVEIRYAENQASFTLKDEKGSTI